MRGGRWERRWCGGREEVLVWWREDEKEKVGEGGGRGQHEVVERWEEKEEVREELERS